MTPHAADAIAPLLKQAFTHASLQDWFLAYAGGEWSSFDWSVAQYLRMFPSKTKPRKAVREFAATAVDSPGSSLTLIAVAAQRLSAWDPGEARAVIRAAVAKSSHPQNRRTLSLSALAAGESRATVRKWLRQEAENELTLEMLEHFNFGPPKLVADYEN